MLSEEDRLIDEWSVGEGLGMAEICCGVMSDQEASASASASVSDTCVKHSSRASRRRRMELRRCKFQQGMTVAPGHAPQNENERKEKVGVHSLLRDCENAQENRDDSDDIAQDGVASVLEQEVERSEAQHNKVMMGFSLPQLPETLVTDFAKFGVVSVCGRRREMEDAVAVHPSFYREHHTATKLHYFGVYDGHGCSHVASRCRERLHELVKEELVREEVVSMGWKSVMQRSFLLMDMEVTASNGSGLGATCRCELQSPECDAVGSTAVVSILTHDKIIVANCGDSRAVLCRNGKPIPLSSDHKPDRPDELNRIEAAGGRVIYWDGARVLGMLAMSRSIGDNYLKPYVTCEPEVTITDRTGEDECLILASDGLWDVVSNEMACGVAHMCLKGKADATPTAEGEMETRGSSSMFETLDKASSEASMLLTKLALARHSTDNISVVMINLIGDT